MHPNKMHGRPLLLPLLTLATAALLVSGCSGGSMSTSSNSSGPTGAAFVVGTDAPMASVTSFSVQVQSIAATDASGDTVQLLSGTPTVDFARFNGLQTLLDMNDVPAGTYTSVSIKLGAATIGYLDTSGGGAPIIKTEAATLTTSTVNVTLTKPLVVVTAGAPVGLHVDFNLRKSIQVDSNDQITGIVTPTFKVNAVGPDDAGAYIDEFSGAVVSVNTGAQSFVMQGPHGRQVTINVTGQTEWDGGASLSDLTTSSIVQVSGKLDRTDASLSADEVVILSQNGFYASGQITYVTSAQSQTVPTTETATSFDLYVRGLLPTTTGLTLGQIATVDLNGSENFSIYWMHNPMSQFLFNSSGLLAGQDVAVGGPASGATNAQAVTVKRVVLRHWGFNGTLVAGSVNTTNDTFQIQINGFAGLLVPQTVTVYVVGKTDFRDGLTEMTDVESNTNVRVVGLLLKDPTSGQTVLIAHYVDALD